MSIPNLDQLRHVADVLERQRQAFNGVFEQEQKVIAAFDQQRQAFDALERQRQAIDDALGREWLPQLAAGERYLKQLATQMQRHEERLKRRRETCERMRAENEHCGRKNCSGTLSIQETKADELDVVIGVSLVCNQCNYEKYPSPDFPVCDLADEFLEAAERLDGVPPFSASFNAYWACELYLRELGGYYYYADGSDEGEFHPATEKHGLSTLRKRLPGPRCARLDAEQCGGKTFLKLFKRLPNGLLGFLRYQEEERLSYPERTDEPKPRIGEAGRLFIDEADVYEVLVQMGRILRKFLKDECRRNRG